MRLGGIVWDSVNAYEGMAVEIYVSGCTHRCHGCHNPEMQSFKYGTLLDDKSFTSLCDSLRGMEGWFDIISILGGDLLCQPVEEAEKFISDLKKEFPTYQFILFTGSEKDEIPDWCYRLFDSIKYGKFIENLRCYGKPYGSSNQGILKKGIDY